MKKQRISLRLPASLLVAAIVATSLLFPSSALAAPYAWQNVGAPGFTSDGAVYTSIAFPTSSSTPYVAFVDSANSGKATVLKYNGTSWVAVGDPGFSAGGAIYTSLVFPTGSTTPYLAYRDEANSSKATVMKYDGGSWVTVGAAGFSMGAVGFTSLAFDSQGRPHVAYRDEANGEKATVMRYDGGTWAPVGTEGFSQDWVEYTSLAIASNDDMYVAFRNGNSSGKATVMEWTGADWQVAGATDLSQGAAYGTHIAFPTSSSTPYLIFQDEGNSNKATVLTFNGSSWDTLGSAGFTTGATAFTYLAFPNGSSTPYAIFQDDGNSAKASVMKYDGSSWVTVGSAGFSANIARYTTLAFDASGTPYAAYRDQGWSNRLTVMSYSIVPSAPTVTTQVASSAGESSVTLNGTITDIGTETPTVRGFVYGETEAYGATTTESGSFGAGAFTAIVTDLYCESTYHYAAYAVNSVGTTTGTDQTFDTAACEGEEEEDPEPEPEPEPESRSRSRSGGSVQARVKNLVDMGNVAAADELKAQWQNLFGATGSTVSGANGTESVRDLELGMTGEDVRALQKLLNANGFKLSETGVGGAGNETNFFGTLTKNALAKYQAAHGVSPSIGYFGPITRAKMKAEGAAGLWW